MLVAMATGTGKTFTMVNQVYRLMKSEVARRVLFLVDRRALAAQAVRAFKSFEPEPALKFNQIYELYSQKFKREDFDAEEHFDPTVLPSNYLLDPKARSGVRLRLHDPATGDESLRPPGAAAAFGELESGDEDADSARYSHPRIRFGHRRRMSSWLHRARAFSLARYAKPLRRHPHWFNGHAGRSHHKLFWRTGFPV